ncbi:rhamnogalacturonan lyase family protein [Aquibacillus kalidii]|uniref:rhamnogalacturonan lyase family protein n=1 Tax=Aquibacillus kalidii TaxID=2762597 RepID=UPI001C992B80|nr:hypothetical protein [Aquibacillus kalidii]
MFYIWKSFIKSIGLLIAFALILSFSAPTLTAKAEIAEVKANTEARQMENLGRGVVAVRDGSTVFISWRLLALDAKDIGFNIYRSSAGGKEVKINKSVITKGTNYEDKTADLSVSNVYHVQPVINGKEVKDNKTAGSIFTLEAGKADGPYVTVPLKEGGPIRNVWVGDFDGDGEYDYFVSRYKEKPQVIEAYKQDGTLLWSGNMGPNSDIESSYNSATIDVGMWDNVTVYDLDGDGKSEVILKIANGVTFGDGEKWSDDSDTKQWIAVLDGMTGKLKSAEPLPDDYISDGPLATQLGIGYLNGKTPSIVVYAKNRTKDRKEFNLVYSAYSYNGSNLVMDWKWLRESQVHADGHQMRIGDFDEDGKDEISQIGFVLNGDGTLKYSLSDVRHGDRFYIGKFDPNSDGFQGYGIQQDNKNGLLDYYYDASNGSMIWQHKDLSTAGTQDVGRGNIGDIDPRYSGYEVWSFDGIYNGPTNTQITTSENQPYPNFRLWWDGDLLSEKWDSGNIDKWDYKENKVGRLVTTWKYENATKNDRKVMAFYGDVLGDWREEVIQPSRDYSKLVIFTTDMPTDTRLYTLAQNPMYRNSMTVRGYYQSHLTDYYLGSEMTTPPTPNIYLAP